MSEIDLKTSLPLAGRAGDTNSHPNQSRKKDETGRVGTDGSACSIVPRYVRNMVWRFIPPHRIHY